MTFEQAQLFYKCPCETCSPNSGREFKSMPSAKLIHGYWLEHADEHGICHQVEEEPCCYACGNQAYERAHIIAKGRGGSFHPSNLVLLCNRCHRYEAPDASTSKPMLKFIATHPSQVELFMDEVLKPIMASEHWAKLKPEKAEEVLEHFRLSCRDINSHKGLITYNTYVNMFCEAVDECDNLVKV